MNTKLIKSVFSDDPDVIRALEAREQADLMKEVLRENILTSTAKAKADAEEVNFKFLKGEKGDEPSDERLQALILPLIPPPVKGEDAKTPTKQEWQALIKPLIPEPLKGDKGDIATPTHTTQIVREELTINEQVVKDIIKMMHQLPEADKLEVSKGIRNANSFIFNGTKYKTEELMHGGGSSSSSSGYQVPTSGTVDGINQVFVWTTAPNVIVVDQGRAMQKVSSDGTVNWTGTTTTTLSIAPTFDIYATS